MTWHLKDRELEKKLIAIDPKFLERINEGAELKDDLRMDTSMMITDHVAVHFEAKDFEDVPEYDPSTWNEYPKVTPPEGVLMRVEFIFEGILRRNCSTFEKGAWRIAKSGDPSYDITLDDVKRFRPWE